ncbi:MAG: hypothetical protein RH917_02755 [Lacipirellulaceae bacterium]
MLHFWNKYLLLSLLCTTSLTGCTSVIGGPYADVTITSNPPQAGVSVMNQKGELVARGTTPMKASLNRSGGLLRTPPKYTAILEKKGYESESVAIDAKLSPWLVGNLAIGSLFGHAAESANEAMWNLEPSRIERRLTPMSSQQLAGHNGHEAMQVTFVSDAKNKR